MKNIFTPKKSVLAVAVAIGTMNLALAQVDAPQKGELERITITGSNIKRVNLETASPVQIITRDEMVRGGATSLNEVLRMIAANVGGVDENRTGGFSAGAAGLNLRGIGSQATLILINGRRAAAYAQPEFQTTFVDLNSIPISAVERIEILKDGASAIYGSEAMAGVVNIILRQTLVGVVGNVTSGRSAFGDGQQSSGSLSMGFGSLVDDHFNAYASLDLRHRQPMLMANRPEYVGTQNWTPWGYADKRNLFAYPGNIFWTDKATNAFVSRTLNKNCPSDSLVPAAVFFGAGATGNACAFDDLKDGTFNSAGKSDRIGLTSRFTWQPNSSTTFFGEAILNQNKAVIVGNSQIVAGQTGQVTPALPITHPQYPQELIDPLSGKTLAGGNGTVRIRASLLDFPALGQDNTTDFARYLLGTKGTFATYDWESGLLFSSSKVSSRYTGVILNTPFVNAYKNGTFLFGATAQNQALYDAITTPAVNEFKSGLYQWDAKVSGEVGMLPAGPISIAAGVEVRREYLETNPDPMAVVGEIYRSAQLPAAVSNSRNIASVYTELSLPVLNDLEAQLAARHDRYSDYGNSTTPKVGLKWNATSSFLLRGTFASGFRAPTLVENSTEVRNASISGFLDPERCNAKFKGGCVSAAPYQSGANPSLKPETGNSWTLGTVWEPASWLNVSVDVWRIRRVDEIGTYQLDKVLSDSARYAGNPAATIIRAPLSDADRAAGATAGEITGIKSLLTNVSLTDIRGVDVDLRGKFDLGEYGRMEPRLQVMLNTAYQRAVSETDDLVDYAGTRGTPKLQATLGVVWKKAPWQISVDAVHIGTTSSQTNYSLPCPLETEGYAQLCNGIASFTTVNLGASYKGFKDWKLSAAVQNAFNRMPPFVPYNGLGYYSPLYSAMGRYMQFTAEYAFR